MPGVLLNEIKYYLMLRLHLIRWYTLSHICLILLLQQDKNIFSIQCTKLALACDQQIKISVF
jgi:uncharacterized membrane protein